MAVSDSNWTLPLLIGGLSSAALIALHFLRVHPLEKRVATILFWKPSGQTSNADKWLGRFRRWLLFLFLLAICLILSLSTRKQWSAGESQRVIVIDTGYSMSAHDRNGKSRLENAVNQASAELSDSSGAILISAGAVPRLLSDSSESLPITLTRMRKLAAEDQPSNYNSALLLAENLLPGNGGQILWYTDRQTIPSEIPNSTARRIQLMHVGDAAPNAAILAVFFQTAQADPGHGELHVRVGASDMPPTAVTIQNKTSGAAMTKQVPGDGVTEVVFPNLAAEGSNWEIQVADTLGPSADNRVEFQLPYHPALRIAFRGKIPMPLRAAMLAIGEEADTRRANVLVSDSSNSAPPQIACEIQVVTPPMGAVAVGTPLSVAPGAGVLTGLDFEDATSGAGSEIVQPHLIPLIFAGLRCVAGTTTIDGRTTLLLSGALLGLDSELPQRAAFPVALERICRQMMNGENASVCVDARRKVDDPAWADEQASSRNPGIAYSMTETNIVAPGPAVSVGEAGKSTGILNFGYEWNQIFLLCGMGLLLIESVLFARNRIV